MSAKTFNVIRAIRAVTGRSVIVKYVRNANRKPIGVVVAIDNGKVGWSKAHSGQPFNSTAGIMMAFHSALNGADTNIPNERINADYTYMVDRSRRYFHSPKPHKSKYNLKTAE